MTKLNATGSALVYSTYLGGSSGDGFVGSAIAVDDAGAPTHRVHGLEQLPYDYGRLRREPRRQQRRLRYEAERSGGALVYSTYLGGTGSDWGSASSSTKRATRT